MKKIYLLLFLLPIYAGATVYTSKANGDWANSAIWNPTGVPSFNDTVTINNTVTVVGADPEEGCYHLIINSGGVLNNTQTFAVEKLVTNNTGGIWKGTGDIGFVGQGTNDTIISGGGDFSGQTGVWYFQSFSASVQTMMIAPSATIVKNGNVIAIETSVDNKPLRILNFGHVTGRIISSGGHPTSWTQEANSGLWLVQQSFLNSYDTLVASAPGNYVLFDGAPYTIKTPAANTYATLYVHVGTKTIPANLIVNTFELLSPSAIANMNGQNMTITGNWLNYGTITNNTGTITFNGSSLQTIGGNKPTRFANMTISGSGNVTLATSTGFTGVLTLNSGGSLVSSGGTDTLISTAASTARVAQITGTGTITANFVVQRYDGRGTAAYQALSSPVQSMQLMDWNNSNRNPPFYMSGVGGPDGHAGTYVSVYLYNEPTAAYEPITNFATPGNTYPIQQGQGIYLWMGNSLTTMSPFTYITHGVPSVGNVSINVTDNDGGFNIIGNPYPSPISWSSLAGGNGNLQNAYYLYESDGSWHTFIGGSFIPMEQGFGVVATASGPVNFQESFKSTTDASLQRTVDPGMEANAVTFTLSDDANTYSCPTIISFGSNFSANYDPSEDAIFIKSFIQEVPQLYTCSVSDNHKFSLNKLPDVSETIDVPLKAIGNVNGNYTISCNNIGNLASYNCVCLIDNVTGAVLNNFEDTPAYTFNISQAGEARNFILRFTKLDPGENCNSVTSISSTSSSTEKIRIFANNQGAIINFNLPKAENAMISVYDVLGEKALADVNVDAYNNQVTIPLPQINNVYIIKVETPSGVTVKKLYY